METTEKEEKRHPTVLRTFRLSTSLDESLTKKAEHKGIGKNALIASILTKYDEWDSIVEDFGYVTVPFEMIAKFIEGGDEDSIESIARLVAKSVASSLSLWYGSADLESVIKYFDTSIKYSGARVQNRIERQGNVTRIIAYQPFSENGAVWARAFNIGLIESVLGYPPKVIEHANSIEIIIESKNTE
jgi:hypothetical protein